MPPCSERGGTRTYLFPADNKKALNLAIKDQIAALEWVKANIEAFGGDKHKVTAFGESAGAIMTSILYFNSPLSKLVRGVILESGSPASPLTSNAEAREIDWQNFVGGVPSCADLATSGNTFDCIKAANTSEIFQGLLTSLSLSQEQFAFDPTIDGPDGLYPDIPSRLFAKGQFARVPFITGTNLDEGTLFTPFTINSEQQVHDFIIANFSPPIVPAQKLETTAEKLVELYPNIPALGSPFNTGNETFGLSSGLDDTEGDVAFQAQRRNFNQVAANAGLQSHGYLFTEPQPGSGPLGGPHWEQYTTANQVIMDLNSANLSMIPDDYRKEQIAFINDMAVVFHHRRDID
ncbi:hypothetical protein C0993_012828 [Termitomyces sp. T159_Od127]|nr:hypothetical protein C0993_012828 [Termitomyces sp. T159_Od127]